ncbi:MAG: sialidase family protein [Methylococcales bacterium]
MKHFSMIIAAICILALVCCASNPSLPLGATPTAPGILGPAGSDPTVAVNIQTGTRYAAWIRPGKDSTQVVVARSDDGQNFTDPVVVSGGDTDIVSATVSPAQVAVGPNGEVYVLYERRVTSRIFEPGRGIPRLARSSDGGRSFEAAIDVAMADSVETSAESPGLAVASNGALIVAWLDHREAFARAKLPEDQRPEDKRWLDSDDPEVEVRLSRSTDGGRNFGPSLLVAAGASERSRIALEFSPDGRLYGAWRAKLNQFKGSYDAVRDALVAFSDDGGLSWSAPVKVHDDRFKAGDCPEITLGMDTDSQGRLHVAWYSGSGIRPGIYYAVSEDRGLSFSKPLTVLADSWVPYADVKLAVDGSDQAWVAFEDRRDGSGEHVVLTRIDPRGTPHQPRPWPGQAPDLAAHSDSVTLLWTAPDGAVQALQVAPE